MSQTLLPSAVVPLPPPHTLTHSPEHTLEEETEEFFVEPLGLRPGFLAVCLAAGLPVVSGSLALLSSGLKMLFLAALESAAARRTGLLGAARAGAGAAERPGVGPVVDETFLLAALACASDLAGSQARGQTNGETHSPRNNEIGYLCTGNEPGTSITIYTG